MRQKVLFIHIAKAAGSSINSFFTSQYSTNKSVVHLESQRDVLENKVVLNDKDFISGHITYREFKKRLDIEKYFVITCLREPVSHLISHIAWIRKLAEPNEKRRFEAHPPYIQKLAAKMRGVDFGSPVAVHALIKNLEPVERRLLDNVQVNYLHECQTNRLIGQPELKSALAVIDQIDLVGIVEHLDLFFRLLSDCLGMKSEYRSLHENIQADKYGMDTDNWEFQAAIEPLIKYDRTLYKIAKEKFLAFKVGADVVKKQPAILDMSTSNLMAKGNLDNVGLKLIHGWCIRLDTTSPAQVALYINNEKIATTVANLPREDIHLKGIHPTGLCGFRFTPRDQFVLHNGDIISVKAIGGKVPVELRNSPRKFMRPQKEVIINI